MARLTEEEVEALRRNPALIDYAAEYGRWSAALLRGEGGDFADADKVRLQLNQVARNMDAACRRAVGDSGLADKLGRSLRSVSMDKLRETLPEEVDHAMAHDPNEKCPHCKTFTSEHAGPFSRHKTFCEARGGKPPKNKPAHAPLPPAPEPDKVPAGPANHRFGVEGGNLVSSTRLEPGETVRGGIKNGKLELAPRSSKAELLGVPEVAFRMFEAHAAVCDTCPKGEISGATLCPLGRAFMLRWSRLELAATT